MPAMKRLSVVSAHVTAAVEPYVPEDPPRWTLGARHCRLSPLLSIASSSAPAAANALCSGACHKGQHVKVVDEMLLVSSHYRG